MAWAEVALVVVKVVVVTMFERGEPTGDAPGELQLWVERLPLDRRLDFPLGEQPLELALHVLAPRFWRLRAGGRAVGHLRQQPSWLVTLSSAITEAVVEQRDEQRDYGRCAHHEKRGFVSVEAQGKTQDLGGHGVGHAARRPAFDQTT